MKGDCIANFFEMDLLERGSIIFISFISTEHRDTKIKASTLVRKAPVAKIYILPINNFNL